MSYNHKLKIDSEITIIKCNSKGKRLHPRWTIELDEDYIVQNDFLLINETNTPQLNFFRKYNKTIVVMISENLYHVVQKNNKRTNRKLNREQFYNEYFSELI